MVSDPWCSQGLAEDRLAVAGAVEVRQLGGQGEARRPIEGARRRIALAGRGVDVDALSAGAAHGGLGAGQDPVAEAAPLAVGMHGDPVEVVAGDRPGTRAVAERKSVVEGKSGSVRVSLGGR